MSNTNCRIMGNGEKEVLENEEEQVLESLELWLNLEENRYLNVKRDRKSLMFFIHGCKCKLEKVKNKIVRFYEMKSRVPEWFKNRDPKLPAIEELLGVGVFIPLLGRDNLNRAVVILRTGAHTPRRHKQADVFKVSKMLLDVALKEDDTAAVNGIIAVFDMKGVGLGHAVQMTPTVIRNAVESIQNYPCRTKNLFFVNSPVHINVVLNIFRSFMSDKIKRRVKVYGDEGFSKLIEDKILPLNILPERYGGTGGKLEDLITHWKNKVIENREWFAEDEKHSADLLSK